MLEPYYTNQFEKDVKKSVKRGKDTEKLRTVIRHLVEENPLPAKFKDHTLSGNYKDFRECHIEPDWLLIYKIEEDNIYFTRIGSHSDLFE